MKDIKFLQISFEFISSHINATTHEVPILLLEQWAADADMSELLIQNQKSISFTVFMYALTKYYEQQGKEEFSFSPKELICLFETFLVLIGLGIIHQKTDIKSNAIRLFDFDNYSNLNIEIQ